MNKKQVEKYIPIALKALGDCGIAHDDKTGKKVIEQTYRGQISSFGAAVSMGSFKSAVAFFSDNGNSSVERNNLIIAIWYIINDGKKKSANDICSAIISETNPAKLERYKSQFLDASVALKLAMNAYTLKK